MSKIQDRVVKVLERIIEISKVNDEAALVFAHELDIYLDSLAQDDFFGTEQQNDPRGDFRDRSNWSCARRVQGVDE
jgi:hypothetical protein